jgi:hypothetical protein
MRSIAARLSISRNTVAKAVSAEGPPTYVRGPQDSGIKAVEPAVRALLRENPRMPATVLAELVGWSGSPAWFRENVARIRPEYAPARPVVAQGERPAGPADRGPARGAAQPGQGGDAGTAAGSARDRIRDLGQAPAGLLRLDGSE